MKIFIMRHGEAANVTGEDSRRPLTKQGILETEKMGHWLAQCKPSSMHVLVSPYLRAQQTCANVTQVLTKEGVLSDIEPETLDFITPSGDARQLHDYLDGLLQENDYSIKELPLDDNQVILLVSHMPFVSYLVAELTSTLQMPIFSTGAIAIIDYDIELMQGHLVDMVSPAKVHC